MAIAVLLSGCTNLNNNKQLQNEKIDIAIKVIAHNETIFDENLSVAKGISAMEALQKLALVETKSYSLGKFITSIAGINASAENYWAFYIDEEYANVGADAYKIEKPVELTFKLESLSNFSEES